MKLIIRADASPRMGTGHIMRCIALAQAWRAHGGEAAFSGSFGEALGKRILKEGFDFIPVENPHPHASDLTQTLDHIGCHTQHSPSNANNWVVLDGYHFDSNYQLQIKKAGHRLLCIDDYGHAGHYYANLVLNQNISADESLYQNREPYTRLLLGTQYALLRKEFWLWRGWKRSIPEIAKNILVTMGGSDPENITLKVIKAIKQLNDPSLEIKVIAGPSNPHVENLQNVLGSAQNSIHILLNVENMPELISWADFAISAAGSTCWELAFMGLPFLTIVLAENQEEIAVGLERAGVGFNCGWFHSLKPDLISRYLIKVLPDAEYRIRMSLKGKTQIDGFGADRVMGKMRAL